jgi:uncharacterized protein YfiM (DUF2279 family)
MNKCLDLWKGLDKKKHFFVCLILSILCPILAIIAAIGKEIYDSKQQGNHFCWKDIVADGIGTLIGGIIHTLIILFIIL